MLTKYTSTLHKEKRKSVLSSSAGITLATCVCLGISFFLLATTVILALIPLYISTNTSPVTSTSSRSQLISMLISVQSNPTGRKRAVGDLDPYIGDKFGQAGNDAVQQTLKNYLPSQYISSVYVSQCTFVASKSSSKSLPLVKRQNLGVEIYLLIELYLLYASSCFGYCQTAHASDFKTNLNTGGAALDLFNIPIVAANGTSVGTLSRVKAIQVTFVSDVVPSSSSNTPAPTPAVVTVITTSTNASNPTTTVAATPSLG